MVFAGSKPNSGAGCASTVSTIATAGPLKVKAASDRLCSSYSARIFVCDGELARKLISQVAQRRQGEVAAAVLCEIAASHRIDLCHDCRRPEPSCRCSTRAR